MSAVFPDAGNESSITDFDIYFTSNPGARLSGGQDRDLQASPN